MLYSKNKAIKKSARFFGALVYLKARIWKGAYQDTRIAERHRALHRLARRSIEKHGV
jgi:hypothetical protein